MATLAANPRYRLQTPEEIKPEVPTQVRGQEGEILVSQSRGFLQRWLGYRRRGLVASHSEDTDYQAMPPRRTYTVHVRYNFRGRGKPLPYPLDDEE